MGQPRLSPHLYARGAPDEHNFLLEPGVDADAEILEVERLLIANGQTPSLFFRFPGLISSAPLMLAVRRHHLISLGADAWLALDQRPSAGSIVLVHANGNEPRGVKLFERDLARDALPLPFEPLTAAPNSVQDVGAARPCRRGRWPRPLGKRAALNDACAPDALAERVYRRAPSPRPMNGILVAISVIDRTFDDSGRLAM